MKNQEVFLYLIRRYSSIFADAKEAEARLETAPLQSWFFAAINDSNGQSLLFQIKGQVQPKNLVFRFDKGWIEVKNEDISKEIKSANDAMEGLHEQIISTNGASQLIQFMKQNHLSRAQQINPSSKSSVKKGPFASMAYHGIVNDLLTREEEDYITKHLAADFLRSQPKEEVKSERAMSLFPGSQQVAKAPQQRSEAKLRLQSLSLSKIASFHSSVFADYGMLSEQLLTTLSHEPDAKDRAMLPISTKEWRAAYDMKKNAADKPSIKPVRMIWGISEEGERKVDIRHSQNGALALNISMIKCIDKNYLNQVLVVWLSDGVRVKLAEKKEEKKQEREEERQEEKKEERQEEKKEERQEEKKEERQEEKKEEGFDLGNIIEDWDQDEALLDSVAIRPHAPFDSFGSFYSMFSRMLDDQLQANAVEEYCVGPGWFIFDTPLAAKDAAEIESKHLNTLPSDEAKKSECDNAANALMAFLKNKFQLERKDQVQPRVDLASKDSYLNNNVFSITPNSLMPLAARVVLSAQKLSIKMAEEQQQRIIAEEKEKKARENRQEKIILQNEIETLLIKLAQKQKKLADIIAQEVSVEEMPDEEIPDALKDHIGEKLIMDTPVKFLSKFNIPDSHSYDEKSLIAAFKANSNGSRLRFLGGGLNLLTLHHTFGINLKDEKSLKQLWEKDAVLQAEIDKFKQEHPKAIQEKVLSKSEVDQLSKKRCEAEDKLKAELKAKQEAKQRESMQAAGQEPAQKIFGKR
jgi:hypothetical protein